MRQAKVFSGTRGKLLNGTKKEMKLVMFERCETMPTIWIEEMELGKIGHRLSRYSGERQCSGTHQRLT